LVLAQIVHAYAADEVYTITGKEFGSEKERQVVFITCKLYGLRSSWKALRYHRASTLLNCGFASLRGDPDVPAMKVNTNPDG
jgi:hypothetical protein